MIDKLIRDSHADMETLCDESGVCLDGDEASDGRCVKKILYPFANRRLFKYTGLRHSVHYGDTDKGTGPYNFRI